MFFSPGLYSPLFNNNFSVTLGQKLKKQKFEEEKNRRKVVFFSFSFEVSCWSIL